METVDLTKIPVVDNHCHGITQDQTFEGIDLLDPTKIVPEELAPVQPVGRLTLNANPLKVREYLASGLPVVSSDLPGWS